MTHRRPSNFLGALEYLMKRFKLKDTDRIHPTHRQDIGKVS